MPIDQLLLFIVAGLLLNLTPGPDVLLIVSHALRSGARAGLVAAAGICAGCMVHIVAGAVGVSALVAASASAFTVLKWVGAAYLVYIGVRALLSRSPAPLDLPQAGAAPVPADLRRVFWQGFATNALNPKVALFFLAFLPQFIGPQVQDKTLAFLLLGLLFDFNALWVCAGWAVAAAWLARRVGAVRRSLHGLERAAGALFVAFGLKLALSEPPTR
ncbi:LysE family translocator [Ramlibacter sp. MAHUQ-53]|uniref:LysE family translocator n=1 Tax=unclassified Ramlibacter TaxID=2617605 RepID=UPI00362F309D